MFYYIVYYIVMYCIIFLCIIYIYIVYSYNIVCIQKICTHIWCAAAGIAVSVHPFGAWPADWDLRRVTSLSRLGTIRDLTIGIGRGRGGGYIILQLRSGEPTYRP